MEQKNLESLKAVAKTIQGDNPEIILSGSLALKLDGFELRRNVCDLDFVLPHDFDFVKSAGMEFVERDGDEYDEEDFERIQLRLHGVSIDVFKAIHKDVFIPESTHCYGLDCIPSLEILKWKIHHALDNESSARYKHKDDLIHILINN